MNAVCETCGAIGFEHLLLCCSDCKGAHKHQYCLGRVLFDASLEDWFCDECNQRHNEGSHSRSLEVSSERPLTRKMLKLHGQASAGGVPFPPVLPVVGGREELAVPAFPSSGSTPSAGAEHSEAEAGKSARMEMTALEKLPQFGPTSAPELAPSMESAAPPPPVVEVLGSTTEADLDAGAHVVAVTEVTPEDPSAQLGAAGGGGSQAEREKQPEASAVEVGMASGSSGELSAVAGLAQSSRTEGSTTLKRMAHHQDYPLLELEYDKDHRGHFLADLELQEFLTPLRPRVHRVHRWDERYAPYIRRAGFLELARVFNSGLPVLDPALLTTAVDRWRPETHTFHLPCGEMTITLQDVKLILCLQLGGLPVTGVVDGDHWVDAVEQFCGRRPPDDEEAKRAKKTSGVTSAWITQNFGELHSQATEVEVERYARVWLWHFLGAFLFPDASGNTISWAFLNILSQPWESIAAYSWGSAVLAWMYRQLCVACRRTADNANLGGCCHLLQVWCWERFPIGRPILPDELPEWNHEDVGPTALYVWTNATREGGAEMELVRGNPQRRYRMYTDNFDVLTQYQVIWCPWVRMELDDYLSPRVEEETDEWRTNVGLIFFHVVEMHLPSRVCRQFGRLQPCPPPPFSTNRTLHRRKEHARLSLQGIRYDRRNRYKEKNWAVTHHTHIMLWQNRQRVLISDSPPHDQRAFDEYLEWLHTSTRTHLKASFTDHTIGSDSGSDVAEDEYDVVTREGTQPERAPLQRYVAIRLSRLSNEAIVRLAETRGEPQGIIHHFVKKVSTTCRKLAQKLSYMQPPMVPAEETPLSPYRSSTLPTAATSSGFMAQEDSQEYNEIGMSQLGGAPFGTQLDDQGSSGTQQFRRMTRHHDCTNVGYTPKLLPTQPKRIRRPRHPLTLGT